MNSLEKELEIKLNKNQLIPKLTKLVQNNQEIKEIIFNHNLDIAIAERLLVQLIIHKRIDIPTAVGMCYYIYKNPQLTADKVIACINAGLCTFDIDKEQLVVKFDVPANIQKELDVFMFPMPLVVEPKKLEKNSQNGYYIADTGSVILNHRVPKYDVNLEHLNRVNRIKLRINNNLVQYVKELNQWKITKEVSRKNWNKFCETAQNVHNWFTGKTFWLTNKYDDRGRTYSIGYFINPQGTDWNKSVIELANEELVN